MNIANLNGVGSVSKIKNPSILDALIIFVFPAIQKIYNVHKAFT